MLYLLMDDDEHDEIDASVDEMVEGDETFVNAL